MTANTIAAMKDTKLSNLRMAIFKLYYIYHEKIWFFCKF